MHSLYNSILTRFKSYAFVAILACIPVFAGCSHPASASQIEATQHPAIEATSTSDNENLTTPQQKLSSSETKKYAKKILFFGDSMTGWMGERLNAWGDANGFEVATVVWDGSTIKKWAANTEALTKIIREQNPDAVMISLGMNDLFAPNPEAMYSESVDKILAAIGDRPYLWVGPPSWPGHSEGKKFTTWVTEKVGETRFYDSLDLQLSRQSKTNPHPTRSGIEKWIDTLVEWIPSNAEFTFPTESTPAVGKMTRGKYFLYKTMKEKL